MNEASYAFNVEFNNKISALIRIGPSIYFLKFNSTKNDLEITRKKFELQIKNGFLSTVDDSYPLKKTQLPFTIRTYTPTYLDVYTIIQTDAFNYIASSEHLPYKQVFDDSELVQRLSKSLAPNQLTAHFIAIVDYDRTLLNLTIFTRKIAITITMKTKNESLIVKENFTRIFKENLNFLKCFNDFMVKKFEGKLPVVSKSMKSEFDNLFILIASFFFCILLTALVVLILRIKKKRKDRKSIGSRSSFDSRKLSTKNSKGFKKYVSEIFTFSNISGMLSFSKAYNKKSKTMKKESGTKDSVLSKSINTSTSHLSKNSQKSKSKS